jgi:hypothetical protein
MRFSPFCAMALVLAVMGGCKRDGGAVTTTTSAPAAKDDAEAPSRDARLPSYGDTIGGRADQSARRAGADHLEGDASFGQLDRSEERAGAVTSPGRKAGPTRGRAAEVEREGDLGRGDWRRGRDAGGE